jgi:hypothetical protein
MKASKQENQSEIIIGNATFGNQFTNKIKASLITK